jgi:hypothetical protein
MSNPWNDILTKTEIEAVRALTAKLDPRFAKEQHEFYEGRTINQLNALAHQAWLCCESDSYQLARSYAALKEG